jgi:hypothetical protein
MNLGYHRWQISMDVDIGDGEYQVVEVSQQQVTQGVGAKAGRMGRCTQVP